MDHSLGFSPLMHAAVNNHVPVVELLLRHGAAVDLRNKHGEQTVGVARCRREFPTFNEV